jgi:hypothetical protein
VGVFRSLRPRWNGAQRRADLLRNMPDESRGHKSRAPSCDSIVYFTDSWKAATPSRS